jgi:hypothetical protein
VNENSYNNHRDDSDDEYESPELEAAMATKGWLEAQMVNKIFQLEAKILREELRVETTWPVPYKADEEHDEEGHYEEEGDYHEGDVQDEADYDWEQEDEEYSENDGEEDETWVEEVTGGGMGARKRTRAEFEEEEEEEEKPQDYSEDEYSEDESEYEGDDDEDEEDDYDEEEEEEEDLEEPAMPPSPPTKRVKFAHPCVVPLCDKGYVNKASLQRHVFKDHVRVSDPVAKMACRLLWGETFKGDRLGEINRRYGEYPKGA